MSFSVSMMGKPDAIKRQLTIEGDRMIGQSKEEFDAVRPALDLILDQQVGNGVIHLKANGHATFTNGEKTYGSCNVDVNPVGALLVE